MWYAPRAALMRTRLRRSASHLLALLFLVGVVVFLFRLPLRHGYRFIGNSDRWNHHLSFAAFHAEDLARGTLAAWSESLFMGFDTLALPGNFPSPLVALPPLLGTADVVRVFGYVAAALLALAMVGAYLVLHSLCEDRLAAVAGALIFSLTIFSLLKLSQNDNEYLPAVLTPPLFWLVHTATRENLWRRAALLGLICWGCVFVSFLQPFAYVVIFVAAYAAYRWYTGDRAPLAAFATALAAGAVLGVPRVLLQLQDVARSTRTAGVVLEYVSPTLFLRYLDGVIFGRSWHEVGHAHLINLSEGNLLFSSVFGSLLFLLVVLRLRYSAEVGPEARTRPYGFHVAFVLAVFLVIHSLPVYETFALLFARISFLHSRFTIAAMFPAAIASALFLARPARWRLTPARAAVALALAATVLLLGAMDFDAARGLLFARLGHPPATFVAVPGSRVASVVVAEVLRWLTLAVAFGALLVARRPLQLLDAGTFRTVLALVIVGQSVLAADQFLNGPQTRSYVMPFEIHDSVMAAPNEFLPPTPRQRDRLHATLDNDHYRSVVVCPLDVIAIDCSTAIGMRWRLRLADGYLNGVSKRYMSLPWPPETRQERSLRFYRVREEPGPRPGLPWKLLALLNVRNAVTVTPDLFMNTDRRVPEGLILARNPSPYVYPRVYFAPETVSVTAYEAAEAIEKAFGPCPPGDAGCSPLLAARHPVDYVEGPVQGRFDSTGPIDARFAADRVTVDFPASTRERFLVINEAVHPRWSAAAEGKALTIYPTNVVMRGIRVPPGISRVPLRYRSVIGETIRYLALVLGLGGPLLFFARRRLQALADDLLAGGSPAPAG